MNSNIYSVCSIDRINTRSWKISKSPLFQFENYQAAESFLKSYKSNYPHLYDNSENKKALLLFIQKHDINKSYNSLLNTFVYNSTGTDLIYSDNEADHKNIIFKKGEKVNVIFGDELFGGIIINEPDSSTVDNINKEYYEVLLSTTMEKNYIEKCYVYSPVYKTVDIETDKLNEILIKYKKKKEE